MIISSSSQTIGTRASSCDAELVCVNAGGVYDALNNACTIGETTYSDAAICGFAQQAESGEPSGGSNWLSALQGFDFGLFSNAYCNLAPLFSGGDIPLACQQPGPAGVSGAGPSDTTPKTGRYLLAIGLVVVVGVITYFVIKRLAKK